MDWADLAEERIERMRAYHLRRTLENAKPSESQMTVAGEDGAPKIVCCDCLEPIALERLAALPDAVRCIDCEIEFERAQAAKARQ